MALTNVEPTVFYTKTVFQTLSASGFNESGVSAISRGLRSVLNPEGLPQFLLDPFTRPGFSADTPALFYHPNRLSIDNILLLSELNSGFGAGGFGEADASATQVLETIQESATIDSLPFIRNASEAALNSAFAILDTATLVTAQALSESEEEDITIRGTDFSLAPSEYQAFSDTYDSVVSDTSLNSQFYTRLGLEQNGSISLDSLVATSATGSPTHYAVSLTRSEGDNPSGHLVDSGNSEVSDTLILTAAELSDYSYVAPSNVAWDFINIIELEDSDSNSSYEGRGEYNSVAVITGEETQDAYYSNPYDDGGTPEQTASYTFYSEAGTSTEELTLVFNGINSAGFTDAKAAIEGLAFRLTVSETLADGSINQSVVDLYDSDLDEIKIDFAYSNAEIGMQSNGINVELHVLDTSFDLSNVEVYTRFA